MQVVGGGRECYYQCWFEGKRSGRGKILTGVVARLGENVYINKVAEGKKGRVVQYDY
jgi:hypothetical protein